MPPMRPISTVVLAVLLLTALSPLGALTFPAVCTGQPVLGNLDVCHHAAPALSSQGDMPCVGSCTCTNVPTVVVATVVQPTPLLFCYLLPSKNDRPPQA